jgi:hypothetical protein
MKKTAGLFAALLFSTGTYALPSTIQADLGLDTVIFQIAAKQWVNTETAVLSVSIHATLSDADLVKARASIMDKLAKIASGDWHLTQFDRSQDNSGLQTLFVEAQARVPQNKLTQVYQTAKSLSKPGASYEISGIEFKPSLEEIQQVRAQLRERLYQQARDEILRLNKVYTGQHYTLNNLIFDDSGVAPVSTKMAAVNPLVMSVAMPSQVVPNVSVSNELSLTATIQAASNRTTGNI